MLKKFDFEFVTKLLDFRRYFFFCLSRIAWKLNLVNKYFL